MDKKTIDILRDAGDTLVQRIITENQGDIETWGCLYRTLQPEVFNEDKQEWERVADWQHQASIRLIWQTLDTLTKYRKPEIENLKFKMGTEDNPDFIWVNLNYTLFRDLMCFRIIEKLHEAQKQ